MNSKECLPNPKNSAAVRGSNCGNPPHAPKNGFDLPKYPPN